jgi:hypothetical protein
MKCQEGNKRQELRYQKALPLYPGASYPVWLSGGDTDMILTSEKSLNGAFRKEEEWVQNVYFGGSWSLQICLLSAPPEAMGRSLANRHHVSPLGV